MSSYKKIRDLDLKLQADKDDELAVSDKDVFSTNRISIGQIVSAAFSHSDSVFEADASGNLILKDNAIDGSKIIAGTIKGEQLAPGSITAEQLTEGAVQEHLTENKTSRTTLVDNTGTVRSISSAYYGKTSFLVNSRSDGLAYSNDHEDGPNPRGFDHTSISGSNVTVSDHGLFEGAKVSISTGSAGVFPESSPIAENQDLYAKLIDKDTFQVSSTSGGSAIDLGPGWSGAYVLKRDVIVSMDVSDWVTSSYTAVYAPTVNYNFSTMESAYSWCSRNASLTYVNFLFAHKSNADVLWNNPGTSSRMSVDSEFDRPKNMLFYGNRNFGGAKLTGWGGAGGAATKSNYHSNLRCRLKVHCKNEAIPIWVRGTSDFGISNIWWIFDYENSSMTNSLIKASGTIFHWAHSSCDIINASGGSTIPLMAAEGCRFYLMGSVGYFGGLSSHDLAHVSGFSISNIGAPSSDAYITTESSGIFNKRLYNARTIASLYEGYTLNNSTGALTGGGDGRDFAGTNTAF